MWNIKYGTSVIVIYWTWTKTICDAELSFSYPLIKLILLLAASVRVQFFTVWIREIHWWQRERKKERHQHGPLGWGKQTGARGVHHNIVNSSSGDEDNYMEVSLILFHFLLKGVGWIVHHFAHRKWSRESGEKCRHVGLTLRCISNESSIFYLSWCMFLSTAFTSSHEYLCILRTYYLWPHNTHTR